MPLQFARRHILDPAREVGLGFGWTHNFADDLAVEDDGATITWRTGIGTQHTFRADLAGDFDAPVELRGWSVAVLAGGAYELSSDTGQTYRFEARGSGDTLLLANMRDRYGNEIILTHNLDGQLQSVATDGPDQPLQTRLTFTWETVVDTANADVPLGKATAPWTTRSRITSVADDQGRVWSYDYDLLYIDHEVRQVLDAVTEAGLGSDARQQTAYTYDRPGGFRIQSITRREVLPGAIEYIPTDTPAAVTSFEYYADGRLFQSIDPTGEKTTLLIHPWQGRRATIDALDQMTRFSLNTIGQTRRIELPLGDHLRFDWDADLQELRSEINAIGQRTQYTAYDPQGRLTAWTDTAGISHAIEYDPNWNQIRQYRRGVGTPLEQVTLWSIDPANGNVLSTTDPLLQIESYTYTAGGLLASQTSPRGNQTPTAGDFTTQYHYDDRGQLERITQPDPDGPGPLVAPIWEYQYLANGAIDSSIDPLGFTTDYQSDTLGRITAEILPDPDGSGPLGMLRTQYDYDYRGNLTQITDPRGFATTIDYDLDDRPIASLDGAGVATQWQYDGLGNLIATTNGLNQTWRTIYDAQSRPVATIDPLGNTVGDTWDAAGRLIRSTNEVGDATNFAYDEFGRLDAVFYPNGYADHFIFDALNRTIQTTQRRDHTPATSHYFYDALDRVVEVHQPNHVSQAMVYDADGNITLQSEFSSFQIPEGQTTDPHFGNLYYNSFVTDDLKRETAFTFDALGRNTVVTLDDNSQIGFDYDSRGQLTRQTDALGRSTQYVYDSVGWLRQVIQPDPDGISGSLTAPVWNYQYDAAGNLVAVNDPLNHRTETLFDGAGRSIGTIDALGNITRSLRDAVGRVVTQTDPLYRSSHIAYDAAGRISSQTAPDPDASGPLPAPVTRFTYDAAGRTVRSTDVLGRSDDYQYDTLGRVTHWLQPSPDGTSPRPEHQWNYGAAPNHLNNSRANGATSRVYTDPNGVSETTVTDAQGRLVSQQLSDTGTIDQYIYDGLQNLDQVKRTSRFRFSLGSTLLPNNGQQQETYVFTHDALGQIDTMTVTDHTGDSYGFDYDYDLVGNLLQTTDYMGTVTGQQFDDLDRMIASTVDLGGANEATTNYAYDPASRLTQITDPMGVITQFGYDRLGRTITQTDDLGGDLERTWRTIYDPVGNQIASIDPAGILDMTRFDRLDRPVAEFEDFSGRDRVDRKWAYDAAENLVQLTDPRGFNTAIEYDALDRPTRMTAAAGTPIALSTGFAYDSGGRLVDETNPEGVVTHYTYQFANRLATVTEDFGGDDEAVTIFGSDGLNRTQGYVLPRGTAGTTYQTSVDWLGRTTAQIRDAGGVNEAITTWNYADASRQITVVDPLNHTTTYNTDALGRMTRQTGPDPDAAGPELPEQRDYVYDVRGFLAQSSIMLSETDEAVTTYATDALGRTTSITNPLGHMTHFAHDPLDRVTRVTDPLDQTIFYHYDNLGRLKSETDAAFREVKYEYDDADNLTMRSVGKRGNAPIQQTDWTYDALGRAQAKTDWALNVGSEVTAYHYDAITGRVAAVEDDDTREEFQFDRLGRLLVHDSRGLGADPDFGHQYAYNDAGDLVQRIDHSLAGSIATITAINDYTIDSLGRMASITRIGPPGQEMFVDFDYDLLDRQTHMDRFADAAATQLIVSSAQVYDAAGRMTELTHTDAASAPLAAFAYQHDRGGRAIEIDSLHDGVTAYQYDLADQIISASRNGISETFAWDAVGNRSSAVIGPGNRLLANDDFRFTYDDAGRRTSRIDTSTGDSWEYHYGPDGRLATEIAYAFVDPAVGIHSIATHTSFDALGRRHAVSTDIGKDGILDDGNVFYYAGLSENENVSRTTGIDGSTTGARTYLHGPALDQVLADWDNSPSGADTAIIPLTDHLGSVTSLAEFDSVLESTIPIGQRTYGTFGSLESQSGTAAAVDHIFGFAGSQQSGTDNSLYLRNRTLDPSTGRFNEPDPIGLIAGDINFYRYVGNDPVGRIDPLGLQEQVPFAVKPVGVPLQRHSPGALCDCACDPSADSADLKSRLKSWIDQNIANPIRDLIDRNIADPVNNFRETNQPIIAAARDGARNGADVIADQVVFGSDPDVNARANAARQEAIDRGDTLSRIGYISGRVGAIANFGTVAIAAAPASSLVPAYAAVPVLVTATGGGAAATYYRGTAAYYAYQAGDTLAFEDNLLYSIESGIGTIAGGAQLRSTIAPWRTTTTVPQGAKRIGSGGFKEIREVPGDSTKVHAFSKTNNRGELLEEMRLLREIEATDQVPVLRVHGIASVDGRPALILDNIPGATTLKPTEISADAVSRISKNGRMDLLKISSFLQENEILDFQILVSRDGCVLINDPLDFTPGVRADTEDLRFIEFLIQSAGK